MSFIKKKKRLRFEPEMFEESTSYLQNPGCGWYRIYPFVLEETQDFEELYWCLRAEESIVLALVDIGTFREKEISEEALHNLADILDFFGKHEKDVILRITYDREGRGMEHEPDFLNTVIGHMQQLGAVIRDHREQILVVQGVLIGSWGEMHDSKFLSEERLKQLMKAWREALGDIAIAVRTPQQWRLLHAEKMPVKDKVGLFNDGMFGSMDDLGTYGSQKRAEIGWCEKWCREEELKFTGNIASDVPYGGEAVDGNLELSMEEVAEEMRTAKVCYLNCTHDERRLEQWKQMPCGITGIWAQKTMFDYIGCHLGYRFVVRETGLVKKKEIFLKVRIENTGFSTLKEETELLFIIENMGEQECHVLPDNLCTLQPQETAEITIDIPGGRQMPSDDLTGSFVLAMRRKRDNCPISFANTHAKDGSVRLGTYSLS